MLERLTLKQLRSLEAIAELGVLVDAANDLSLTPPAVHSQIKKMDDLLGTPTLVRDANLKRLIPTEHGKILVNATRQIKAILDRASDNLTALQRGQSGHVQLGFESTGRFFATALIVELKRNCPDVDLSFTVANRKSIIEELTTGGVDLAIMGRPPRFPMMEVFPIGPHPFGMFVPKEHPLARTTDYSPELLIQQSILAREHGSATRTLLDRYLDRLEAYGTPQIIELDSNESIKEGVISGLGAAMLSLHVVQRELKLGLLHQLSWNGLPIMRYWYLVHRSTPDIMESTQRIQSTILDMHGAFLPNSDAPS